MSFDEDPADDRYEIDLCLNEIKDLQDQNKTLLSISTIDTATIKNLLKLIERADYLLGVATFAYETTERRYCDWLEPVGALKEVYGNNLDGKIANTVLEKK